MGVNYYRKIHASVVCCLLICAVLTFSCKLAFASVDPFPHYPSLKANVEFWKKVYTQYPSTKGFIHDNRNLAIIYEVIELDDPKEKGARKANKKRIKRAKDKYRKILKNLAKGLPANSKEEKRVQALWGEKTGKKELKRAADNIRFQHCIKEKFEAGLIRSGRYMKEMRGIIRSYGLPGDLVYLPHVESSFNYKAYSKFGAAGIWQFIRSTGQRFLTINYTLDERRSPLKATHAAAQYLKENYQKLGSWPLALTAYNHGANGMLRAKNQKGSFEKIVENYKSRSFGFASRNFYAQFLAAREIAKDYKSHFKGLAIESPLKVHGVELKGYYALDDLVKHFGVSVDTIKRLNPGLRKPVYDGQKLVPKGYVLQLPDNKKVYKLAKNIPAKLLKKEQTRSRFYRVNRGDTAGKIARMHRVKLRDLISSNNLGRQAQIYVGQNLVIPYKGRKKPVKVASLSGESKKKNVAAKKINPKNKKMVASVKNVVPNAGKKKAEPIILASADLKVSKKGNEPLLLALSSSSSYLNSEKSIDKFLENEEAQALKKAIEPKESSPQLISQLIIGDFGVKDVVVKKGRAVGVIKVEAWETLGHYADWLDVPTRTIRRLNNLSFGRSITTNQKIKIPLHKVSKEIFEERRYEFHKEVEDDFFAAFKVVESQNYKVKKGDNIWALCREELGVPFWLVKKYNSSLSFDNLKPDQVIIVPIIEKI